MRNLVLAVSVTLVCSASAVSRAGIAIDAPAMLMLDMGKVVPTNARLLLVFGFRLSPWNHPSYCAPEQSDDGSCPVADLELQLRVLPGSGPAKPVPLEERFSVQMGKTVAELLPKAPLSANTLHELWLHDRSPLGKHQLLAAFVTDAGPDLTAPEWGGPMVAEWEPMPPNELKGFGGPATTPVLKVQGPAPRDGGPVWYRVWLSSEGPADLSKPPTGWASSARPAGDKVVLRLGFYEHVPVELPAEQIVHVGLRAIDLAGNASTPLRFTVDTHKKPAKKPK